MPQQQYILTEGWEKLLQIKRQTAKVEGGVVFNREGALRWINTVYMICSQVVTKQQSNR